MSDTQVRDEVLTIFLAGYETGANALILDLVPPLPKTPEVESKLHAELNSVPSPELLDPGSVTRLPTPANYPNLRYTEQVFAESMRLYPPAWAMGRMAIKDATLGPYNIPAGAHIFFSQYIMSLHTRVLPRPAPFLLTPTASPPRQKPPALNSPTSPSAASTANAAANPSPDGRRSHHRHHSPAGGA